MSELIGEHSTIQIEVEYGVDGRNRVRCGDTVIERHVKAFDIDDVIAFLGLTEKITLRRRKLMDEYQVLRAQSAHDSGRKTISSYSADYAKAKNRALFELTHVTASRFKKLFAGKMFEAFAKHIPEHILNRYCYGNRGIDSRKLNAVNAAFPLVVEADKDGIDNIIPFIIYFNSPPTDLRKMFGKGLWKKLCSNSRHRNQALVDWSFSRRREEYEQVAGIERLKTVVDLPTSLLKHNYGSVVLRHMFIHHKGTWSKRGIHRPYLDLLHDTLRMLTQYGHTTYDVAKWTERRIWEEHDRLIKLACAQRYSDTRFEWADSLPLQAFCFSGYEVIPLLSAKDIGLEGNMMRHCVGSYASQSRCGTYLVYSVRKDGMPYSTIGFRMEINNGEFSVEFKQHYKACNALVHTDDAAWFIPDFIQTTINNPRHLV